MTRDEQTVRPPSVALFALEGRAWLELAALLPALPVLRLLPRGDGHPVLVLPGYLASDNSTRPLRWFLRDRGYHVSGWRLGRNFGPSADVVAGLGRRFIEVSERHGRKVSLVGWSLGGIYAREIARRFPERVRQVITLASPYRDPSATNVSRLGGPRFGSRPPVPSDDVYRRLRSPLPPGVPSTSLYSRSDGIVAWQSCIEPEGEGRENIEVWSSHCGIGHHPAALVAIADRLAQREGEWRRFEPAPLASWMSWMRRSTRPRTSGSAADEPEPSIGQRRTRA